MTGPGSAAIGVRGPAPPDLAVRPIVVAWEVTRACALRCLHCRADAQPHRAPGELDTADGMGLVDDLARFGPVTLILTGGDPMLRPDLVEIAERATARGLRVALTPSATGKVTPARLAALRSVGVEQLAISLDGAGAADHDAMRGVRGSFARSLKILGWARDAGFTIQVNTTITRHNVHRIPQMATNAVDAGAAMWSVFFLVPTGRGQQTDMLDAEGQERALRTLVGMRAQLPLRVKVTAAPAVRRVEQQMAEEGLVPPAPTPWPVNDARGFMFISHDGEVCPSGFLPVSAGNVRSASAVDLYRNAPLFRNLRDPGLLTGRCGSCRWRDVCGGSRARAYALTGDLHADEPTCPYVPEMEPAC